MLLNTVRNQLKKTGCVITLSCLCSTFAFAKAIDCSNHHAELQKVCSKQYEEQRFKLNDKFLTAYLVTDAPVQLLHATQEMWLRQLQQCKSKTCYLQQFDARTDDLNFYTSINQNFDISTEHVVPWAGLRPMMPNMLPVVKQGKQPRVFYNTGHGHLGWTLSAATAVLISEEISQKFPN